MRTIINEFIFNIAKTAGGVWLAICAIAPCFLFFICVMLALLIKPLYTLKKRAWFFIVCLSILSLELGFLSIINELAYFYFTLGVVVLLCLPVAVIPPKSIKVGVEERKLARYVDSQALKAQNEDIAVENPKEAEFSPIIPQKQEEREIEADKFELDFQHVKSVIKKLEYYPLSTADKKIVRELDDAIYIAQTQDFSQAIKSKINDGLGALLKIMSKYGV